MKRVFFLLILAVALAGCGDSQAAQPPIPDAALTATSQAYATVIATGVAGLSADLTQQAETPIPTVAPITPIPAGWQTTHTFTGNGDKQTEIFSVPNDWKILYTCTYQLGGQVDGVLGVEVYNADGTIQDVAIDATCHNLKSTGDTEEHQAGSVYLKILATGTWTVQVQELQ